MSSNYEWQGSGPCWTLVDKRTLIEPASVSMVNGRYWAFTRVAGIFHHVGKFDTLQEAQERAAQAAGVST